MCHAAGAAFVPTNRKSGCVTIRGIQGNPVSWLLLRSQTTSKTYYKLSENRGSVLVVSEVLSHCQRRKRTRLWFVIRVSRKITEGESYNLKPCVLNLWHSLSSANSTGRKDWGVTCPPSFLPWQLGAYHPSVHDSSSLCLLPQHLVWLELPFKKFLDWAVKVRVTYN